MMMFQDKQQMAMYMAAGALVISLYLLYKSRSEGFARPKQTIRKMAAPKPKGPFREAGIAAGMAF